METSSKALRQAWSSPPPHLAPLNLMPCDTLVASSEDRDDEFLGQNPPVSSSFSLPSHSESVWKHDNLCDFFLTEQLHRRIVRIMFALTESMADIWEQFDFNYFFRSIPKTTFQDVLQPYVVERPSIAVLGPTNSGKTTLLNVLLGKWWLPEQETPNTEVVWRISNGKRAQRIRRTVQSEQILEGSSDWNIEQWLCDGELKEKALRRREGEKEVFFDLRLPNYLLSCGVELWDTPSLSYDKWNMLERLIFSRKNVIPIFIVDAQECLGEDRDVRFIKTIRSKHPNVPFLIVLGRIDVSLMQLRMDHSFESSTLDSDDDEKVKKEVVNCERMRIQMQVPTAKYHNLISNTRDIGVIAADKVWEELSNEKPKQLRYTEQFNQFIELLLDTHCKRIQRPFFRIYARLMQAILCAKSCLRILQDEDFNKERCLRESRERLQRLSRFRKSWTEFYAQTRSKYLKILQQHLAEKNDDILKLNAKVEGRSDEKIESYITNVLVSQAVGAANTAVETDLYKKCHEYLLECLKSFEGSAEWIEGIFREDALKLSNDFLWDRSLIQAAPLKKYIQQFASRFRKNPELQKIQRIISSIDYDRILSTVFSFYDTFDNDVQHLAEISNHMLNNLSLTCNLKRFFVLSHEYFSALESRINLLYLLSSTLDKVHKDGILKIENEDHFFVGPLPVDGKSSEVAYAVSLQQKRIQHIEKSLQFVSRDFSIKDETFLKPLKFSFDYRKHILVLYPNFGPSLHQYLTEGTARETWNLQQAVFMAMDLHRAFEYFCKATKKQLIEAPDWGPQFIMLKRSADGNWRASIVLMGEIGVFTHYSEDEEIVHLPADHQKWRPDDLMAYQVIVAFWLLVMKLLLRPPLNERTYQRQPAWKYYMTEAAKDASLVTEAICWFFCEAFNSKSVKNDLRRLLKSISEKFHDRGFSISSDDDDNKSSSNFFLSQSNQFGDLLNSTNF